VGIGGVAGVSLRGEAMLRRIADQTGGRAFFPPGEADIAGIAGNVSADAHSRYLITYTPENQRADGVWRQIAVEVPNGYRVRTRADHAFADEAAARHMHSQFEAAVDSGGIDRRHVVDNDGGPPDETAAIVVARQREGLLRVRAR